jgi:hypothetical protein
MITHLFHKCADGRKRKNNIISFEKEGCLIEEDDNLLKHASEYYPELFGPPTNYDVQLDPTLWEVTPRISGEENAVLCKPFSEAEIKEALGQMEKNKAAGPDKIPIEFYQN